MRFLTKSRKRFASPHRDPYPMMLARKDCCFSRPIASLYRPDLSETPHARFPNLPRPFFPSPRSALDSYPQKPGCGTGARPPRLPGDLNPSAPTLPDSA